MTAPRTELFPVAPVRCLLIGEYTMGHVPYIDGLDRAARARTDIELDVVRLPYSVQEPLRRLPGYGDNWSIRASLLARRVPARRWRSAEIAVVHTQTASLLLTGWMRRVPTWISMDATPKNVDEVAEGYAHRVWPAPVEKAKCVVLKRPMQAAENFVVWSSWVERSLVRDYGVAAERIHVVRPGSLLPDVVPPRDSRRQVRLLFVGGDFRRKGGPHLLTAFRGLTGDVSLDLVTHARIPEEPRIRVHRGLAPGSPELLELLRSADVAVLPTVADAAPFAVVEAMAYGLPVVSTQVGAIGEAVLPERTGLLVPPSDPGALHAALQRLVDRPEERQAMGRAGRERAEQLFDGHRSADRVLDLLRDAALRRRAN